MPSLQLHNSAVCASRIDPFIRRFSPTSAALIVSSLNKCSRIAIFVARLLGTVIALFSLELLGVTALFSPELQGMARFRCGHAVPTEPLYPSLLAFSNMFGASGHLGSAKEMSSRVYSPGASV